MKKNFRFIFITFSVLSLFSFISCGTTKSVVDDSENPVAETLEAKENPTEENQREQENPLETENAGTTENTESEPEKPSEEFDFENAEIVPEEEAYFVSEEPAEENEVTEAAPDITEEPLVKEVPVETEKPAEITVEKPAVIAVNSKNLTENKASIGDKAENKDSETTVPAGSESPEVISDDTAEEDKESVENSDDESDDKTKIEEISEKIPVIPSRTVKLQKGQYLDVEYPGNGWIYLGEEEDLKCVTYFGRKLGKGNTVFTLRTRNSGTTLLHFYKNDALTGTYIDDYLEVIIEDKIGSSTQRTTAPLYSEVVPKKPEKAAKSTENTSVPVKTEEIRSSNTETASALPLVNKNKENKVSDSSNSEEIKNTGKTVIQTTENDVNSDSPVIQSPASSFEEKTDNKDSASSSKISDIELPQDSDSLLEMAQKSYDTEKYADALFAIQTYLDNSGDRSDEALYLQGLIYEAESPYKNIRNAIDCYDTLVKNYPASSLWKKARNRSIYLKRFYVEIR